MTIYDELLFALRESIKRIEGSANIAPYNGDTVSFLKQLRGLLAKASP